MTLQDAVNRAKSEYDDEYPDIFDSSAGLFAVPELKAVGIPTWNRLGQTRNRRAVLEIRTFRGISSNAVHYYGKIVIEGVYVATLNKVEIPRNLSSEELKPYPLFDYTYKLVVKRPLTQIDIDTAPDRWYSYSEGNLTERFNSVEELINDVKEIFKLRFTGTWDFYVQYPRGEKRQIII